MNIHDDHPNEDIGEDEMTQEYEADSVVATPSNIAFVKLTL